MRTAAEIVAVILAVLWYASLPDRTPPNQTGHATPAPELSGAGKTAIAPPRVPVYGGRAKTDLGLPGEVVDDPNKYVLGSVKLPNDTHGHTVTTVIDAKTGETDIYTRHDPSPWLATEQTGYARLSYGVRTGIGSVTRLSVSESLLQVKALHFGIDGSLDSDGQGYIGAHVEYRW